MYTDIVATLRKTYNLGKTQPIAFRKHELTKLKALLIENESRICDTVYEDLRRCKSEVVCHELIAIHNEIDSALEELDEWVQPTKVTRNVLQILDKAYTIRESLGVVLIMGTWNYPILMTLLPAVGAIAAGNCVVIKPSEIAGGTADLLADLLPKYIDPHCYHVINGGAEETTELLQVRFDHIFFTGGTNVGRTVMSAAAKFLTPVTLELGGKSPAVVDSDCSTTLAAKRIGWGKFISCGQTCLAPDYIICTKAIEAPLVQGLISYIKSAYGADASQSPDYCRIISAKHFDRLTKLLEGCNVAYGGAHDRHNLYIEPTIVTNVSLVDAIMQEEIFGPILPIITVEDMDEAIQLIRSMEKPLALYLFTRNETTVEKVLRKTHSGGATINDVILHHALDSLPFGGVGESGIGRYHGKFSFETFTHEKAVLQRKEFGEQLLFMRYPPYDAQKFYYAQMIAKKYKLPQLRFVKYLALFLLGYLFCLLVKKF